MERAHNKALQQTPKSCRLSAPVSFVVEQLIEKEAENGDMEIF